MGARYVQLPAEGNLREPCRRPRVHAPRVHVCDPGLRRRLDAEMLPPDLRHLQRVPFGLPALAGIEPDRFLDGPLLLRGSTRGPRRSPATALSSFFFPSRQPFDVLDSGCAAFCAIFVL